VNPANGDSTVVAMGLQGPNGVAVSTDPTLFYVGSFEGSGVYKVKMTTVGELGQASVFARPNGSKLKDPVLSCPANKEGESCDVPGQFTGGTCKRIANVIDCIKEGFIKRTFDATPPENGGGIDGLGVDVCGNVYATEFRYRYVWRISPSGTMEKLATLSSDWIPNVKWGRGLGGFAIDVMYVADRDKASLFAVSVGVAGASSRFGVK
jgi:sugar lactone lactonase YvrE